MATVEPVSRPHDRHSRRRPFTNWMKRLTNLKSSSDSGSSGNARNKKGLASKNNPYSVSVDQPSSDSRGRHLSFHTPHSGRSPTGGSPSPSKQSLPVSSDGNQFSITGHKSKAPTLSTQPGTIGSDAAQSKTTTAGGALGSHYAGGESSTFSSPAPSVRSLTTTLTTIQSTAPSNLLNGGSAHVSHPTQSLHQTIQFSHQFPTSSSPASAIPSHVTGNSSGGHPATYSTATANNLLTDNASILTLASSSKRRRRNSLDTNASIRALAPSSIFGGSRESLPLSVLSGNVGDQGTSLTAGHIRPGLGGTAAAERASIYSASGALPALTSERNSYYANKQSNTADGISVRSGLVTHGRNDSTTGSIGGTVSPLAGPRDLSMPGRMSRNNSGWCEIEEGSDDRGSQNIKALAIAR